MGTARFGWRVLSRRPEQLAQRGVDDEKAWAGVRAGGAVRRSTRNPSHELSLGAARPEATWVQPMPDYLASSPEHDPAEVAVSRETIRLAFIAALQHLLPRQRAVLIPRDVLKWRANEVAELLETSEDNAVPTTALHLFVDTTAASMTVSDSAHSTLAVRKAVVKMAHCIAQNLRNSSCSVAVKRVASLKAMTEFRRFG